MLSSLLRILLIQQHHQVDLKLKQYMGDFLRSLEDADPVDYSLLLLCQY